MRGSPAVLPSAPRTCPSLSPSSLPHTHTTFECSVPNSSVALSPYLNTRASPLPKKTHTPKPPKHTPRRNRSEPQRNHKNTETHSEAKNTPNRCETTPMRHLYGRNTRLHGGFPLASKSPFTLCSTVCSCSQSSPMKKNHVPLSLSHGTSCKKQSHKQRRVFPTLQNRAETAKKNAARFFRGPPT